VAEHQGWGFADRELITAKSEAARLVDQMEVEGATRGCRVTN
jgi:hypothetical protein